MRRKVLQDLANTVCAMLVGWRTADDLETFATLPDGSVAFDLLAGTATHSESGPLNVHIAGELSAWMKGQCAERGIALDGITHAHLRASYRTDRIPTNRKQIVSFDWKCQSEIVTSDKTYHGHLIETQKWHRRSVS